MTISSQGQWVDGAGQVMVARQICRGGGLIFFTHLNQKYDIIYVTMKKILLMTSVMALVTSVVWADKVYLFNGRDLSGWTAHLDYDVTGGYTAQEPTWFVRDGKICSTGTPFGYLRTKRGDFADFKLHVEYRWWRETVKPNSGVFVRLSAENSSFAPTCYENQLCRGKAADVLTLGGSVFAGFEPATPYHSSQPLSGIRCAPHQKADSEKAFGEWNTIEVEIKGDMLINTLNGVEQNCVKGLETPRGAIALQSEGGAVEFRNIWIEESK